MSMASSISLDASDDFLPPQDLQPHAPAADQTIIAPWLTPDAHSDSAQESPVPSTSSKIRTLKSSFSLTTPNLRSWGSEHSLLRSRTSESDTHSFVSTTPSMSTVTDTVKPPQDVKKKPSSNLLANAVRKVRSKSRLRPVKLDLSAAEPVPALRSSDYIPYAQPSPPTMLPSTPRLGRRGKRKAVDIPPPVPSKDTEYLLDKDIDNMDGIIDLEKWPDAHGAPYVGAPSSPSSGFESSAHSSGLSSDVSSNHYASLIYHDVSSNHYPTHPIASTSSLPTGPAIPTIFNDPFQPSPNNLKRKLAPSADHKISPKTRPSFSASVPSIQGSGERSWIAPESWAVVQTEDGIDMAEGSSSDGEDPRNSMSQRRRKKRHTMNGTQKPWRAIDEREHQYRVRVYRANNTYHVANIELKATVSDLIPYLKNKLLMDPSREMHRLYLKERGRERLLGMTEKPAAIVRKRLEQAGYTEADGLDSLGGDDIQFLMKFVYKSSALGPADEDLVFDNFEQVDLAARALKTVPVVLYAHTDEIISLNLSRNPMLEIPKDFIQSCSILRVLRLQNMSMKKVPSSVRYCVTLHRLDLSSNRIINLEDAGLDSIPSLRSLKLQNNGMDRLPWYFPRLRALKDLNISNNKFRQLPEVVCKLPNLIDLDISFNLLSDLPDEIGNLSILERLIMVGNQVARFPYTCSHLSNLRNLDCRRNNISDLSVVCLLPRAETILADHNVVHSLDLSFGPSLQSLVASHNDITQLTLLPGALSQPFAMITLDISHAKLSSLDELALSHLTSLETLKVDHNAIRALPDSLGDLTQLKHLSCSNNQLYGLPESIGKLQRLEKLEAHNNSLEHLPRSIWECASLSLVNLTSNLLGKFEDPNDVPSSRSGAALSPPAVIVGGVYMERKSSATSSITGRSIPPLAHSLERLYLGENRITEEHMQPLTLLRELKVLNLSFNHIQVIPPSFLKSLAHLEELYLSGNELTALPTEDLPSLTQLRMLYLNGNKLQSLPQELGRIKTLTVLDVGSNSLKYNINNWEFDWNWNFNQNLRYLNLSGNKRLEIKPDHKAAPFKERKLADFSELRDLKVLGLMDVTTTFESIIPDDTEDRRVRTSPSEVYKLAYGIADTLGQNLSMFDLVHPNFRRRKNEAVFAMFGRASHISSSNKLSKFLHDNFPAVLQEQLATSDIIHSGDVKDALRRAFLTLNKLLHDFLYSRENRRPSTASATANIPTGVDYSSLRSGASGVVLYFVDRTLYAANSGNALAVISRQGNAELLSRKHDPFDRQETVRIRAAEGWVSPKGFVNDEIDISRSFGFYYLLPVVNACPDVVAWELSELDEFVIIGNRGLWDFVSYQTAVDIARSERDDPMIAAQKLRDFAISYGAEGTTMIMVISVAGLFGLGPSRSRQHTLDLTAELDSFHTRRRAKKDEITNRDISRLDEPIPPPQGHVALVFTDIRNSTHLWEANAGMQTAITFHNNLLRRQLRFCGGYEVKTEGDAFMCSFPTTMAALWWCLSVQVQLLQVAWPLEILECEDGKEIYDEEGKLIARGLSVRMGIHCGIPIPDPDPTTHRMDYLGPVVNRAARIQSSAAGGQIMCSADVLREINFSIYRSDSPTEYSSFQTTQAIESIRRIDMKILPVGEVKLKGLEAPETLSLIYPKELAGRHSLEAFPSESASHSRVQFSVSQMKELGLLCLRLEHLTRAQIFRPHPARKGSVAKVDDRADQDPHVVYGNPSILLPAMEKASDAELTHLLEVMATRIENALVALKARQLLDRVGGNLDNVSQAGPPLELLQELLSLLPSA